jgi:hypothetical protein
MSSAIIGLIADWSSMSWSTPCSTSDSGESGHFLANICQSVYFRPVIQTVPWKWRPIGLPTWFADRREQRFGGHRGGNFREMNLKWFADELIKNKDFALALAAVASPIMALIGVFVSLRIATRSVRATLRSTQRREWIRELRDEIAFVAASMAILRQKIVNPQQATRGIELMNELLVRTAKLELMMDPNDPRQCELIKIVQKVNEHAHETRESGETGREGDPIESDVKELFTAAKRVLDDAWQKAIALK